MSAKANYFKIGLFVITGVTLAVIAVVVLGAGSLFEQQVMVETYFNESVQGLDIGAPIKYRGMQIGTVKQLDFFRHRYPDLPEELLGKYGDYIVVVGSVRPTMGKTEEERIAFRKKTYRAGLRVRLVSQGLTGVVFLEADYGDPEEFPLMDVSWKTKAVYVPSAPSTLNLVGHALSNIARDLSQAKLHTIAEHLDGLLVAATKVLKETDLEQLRMQASQVLTELHGTIQDTRHIVNTPAITSMLNDASAAAHSARQFAGDLSSTSPQIKGLAEELPATVSRLNKSLRRIDTLLSNKSQDIEAIVDNFRLVSEDLRELTKNAKRYPSQVLLGEPPPRTNSVKR